MTKLYIKLDSNRVTTAFTTSVKTTINNQKGMDYDIIIQDFPTDFKNDVRKYIIGVDGVFTMRVDYNLYQDYLAAFDYGDMENPNTPLSYEGWI